MCGIYRLNMYRTIPTDSVGAVLNVINVFNVL